MDEVTGTGGAAVARVALPEVITGGRIVAVGRHLDPAKTLAVATALAEAGIPAFELTMNSADALDTISALAARFRPETLLIGAGTVLSVGAAAAAIQAGAHFIVTPHFDEAIVVWSLEHRIPCIPGALSPTEIWNAWRAGASAVKLFPASAVGPSFIREMRGPLPQVPLLPTGGVTVENGAAFIASGAVAIGVGSWLTGSGDARTVRVRAAALVAALRADAATATRPASNRKA